MIDKIWHLNKYIQFLMFKKMIIHSDENLFEKLTNDIQFEDITNGRQGTVLVRLENDMIPLVRTTTPYQKPVQQFKQVHYDIIDKIKETSGLELDFNNALFERYNSKYKRMGYHTDQSQDLDPNSYICLFSTYKNPTVGNDIRTLRVMEKNTKESHKMSLDNNSAIIFSVDANHKHKHKITLETNGSTNEWLGMTLRLSKTFIKFIDGEPHINGDDDKFLHLADEREITEMRQHKKSENNNIGYTYPEVCYTISPSDLLPVINQ